MVPTHLKAPAPTHPLNVPGANLRRPRRTSSRWQGVHVQAMFEPLGWAVRTDRRRYELSPIEIGLSPPLAPAVPPPTPRRTAGGPLGSWQLPRPKWMGLRKCIQAGSQTLPDEIPMSGARGTTRNDHLQGPFFFRRPARAVVASVWGLSLYLSLTTTKITVHPGWSAQVATTEYQQGCYASINTEATDLLVSSDSRQHQARPQSYGVRPRPGRERFTSYANTPSAGCPCKRKVCGPLPRPFHPPPSSHPTTTHALVHRRPSHHPGGEARAPGGCWRGKGSRLVFTSREAFHRYDRRLIDL